MLFLFQHRISTILNYDHMLFLFQHRISTILNCDHMLFIFQHRISTILNCDHMLFIFQHRISTILNCDRVLVIEDGNLMECDTPANLITTDSRFAAMVAQHQIWNSSITHGASPNNWAVWCYVISYSSIVSARYWTRDHMLFLFQHRISTILNCDRVLVIEDGNLMECDSPANLAWPPTQDLLRWYCDNIRRMKLLQITHGQT